MESEIDLRPYLQAILRRWYLLIIPALVLAVVAGLTLGTRPRQPQASADVLIVPNSSRLNFDPRYTTGDATLLTSATFQRQALIELASSGTLEAQVAQQLGASSYVPGSLLAQVQVTNDGDLLRISASGASVAEAVALAEAWARGYERLVDEVYTRVEPGLDEEIQAAQLRYDEAQRELEAYIGQSEQVAVEQQIARLKGLLDGSTEAGTALYTQYLSRTQELDLILTDARTLRAQVAENPAPGLGDSLAALALRARVAGGAELPVQLQFGSITEIAEGASAADLDILIAVLQQEHDRLQSEADALARAIAGGDGTAVGLTAATRAEYERSLAGLQQRLEQVLGRQRALTQRRDIALSSLEILQRKRDEQQVAEAAPQISVRFISAAIQPPASGLIRGLTGAIAGAVLGLTFGLAAVLWLDVLRPRLSRVAAPAGAPGERAAEKPAASS